MRKVPRLKIYSPDSEPFGLTFGEWCTRWWQWLLKIPQTTNPANDHTGKHAYYGQSDSNVFFLCQSIEGITPNPIRSVSILKGKSIFMPILNWISNSHRHGSTEQELIDIARKKMDVIQNLEVRLDGKGIKGLERYRFLSDLFAVELPEDNILQLPAGKAHFISDGYWLFTGPVMDDIVISTFGSCSSGITKIGVTYRLTLL